MSYSLVRPRALERRCYTPFDLDDRSLGWLKGGSLALRDTIETKQRVLDHDSAYTTFVLSTIKNHRFTMQL